MQFLSFMKFHIHFHNKVIIIFQNTNISQTIVLFSTFKFSTTYTAEIVQGFIKQFLMQFLSFMKFRIHFHNKVIIIFQNTNISQTIVLFSTFKFSTTYTAEIVQGFIKQLAF